MIAHGGTSEEDNFPRRLDYFVNVVLGVGGINL